MTRRIDPKRLLVAGGLALVLAGCATHKSPGAGADGTGAGAGAGNASALAGGQGAGGAGAGAGSDSAGVRAPGASMFPTLPSPQDFKEAAGLRDVHFEFDRAALRAEDTRILEANAKWLLDHPGDAGPDRRDTRTSGARTSTTWRSARTGRASRAISSWPAASPRRASRS